ncbi:MAG: hypothetical protein IPJ19_17260 [Planctomycetes bacterium]|nr:hypothetical protein [Planctomycetota bacterium]
MIAFALLLAWIAPAAREAAPLELAFRIPLPEVAGRIDHLALDEEHGRLYVAALGNGSLEVLDLEQKQVWKRAVGLAEPQGVVYLAARDEVWVSEGGGNVLDLYRGATLELVERLKLGPDGDNLRFDARKGELWLGYSSGALAWIDPASRKALGRARLPGHPEAFALEAQGARVFANVPSERGVCVVDREKKEQIAFWPIASAQANYPMLLVESEKRVFLGCRSPGKLIALDTDSGKEALALELSGDVDDLWLDEARGRIYASCGAGTLDVFARGEQPGTWKRSTCVATAKGARTSCFSAARKQLFLAVPREGERAAEIRVYATRE